MEILIVLGAIVFFIMCLFLYSLCRIASIADRRIEAMYRKEVLNHGNTTTSRTDRQDS